METYTKPIKHFNEYPEDEQLLDLRGKNISVSPVVFKEENGLHVCRAFKLEMKYVAPFMILFAIVITAFLLLADFSSSSVPVAAIIAFVWISDIGSIIMFSVVSKNIVRNRILFQLDLRKKLFYVQDYQIEFNKIREVVKVEHYLNHSGWQRFWQYSIIVEDDDGIIQISLINQNYQIKNLESDIANQVGCRVREITLSKEESKQVDNNKTRTRTQ